MLGFGTKRPSIQLGGVIPTACLALRAALDLLYSIQIATSKTRSKLTSLIYGGRKAITLWRNCSSRKQSCRVGQVLPWVPTAVTTMLSVIGTSRGRLRASSLLARVSRTPGRSQSKSHSGSTCLSCRVVVRRAIVHGEGQVLLPLQNLKLLKEAAHQPVVRDLATSYLVHQLPTVDAPDSATRRTALDVDRRPEVFRCCPSEPSPGFLPEAQSDVTSLLVLPACLSGQRSMINGNAHL